MARVFISYSHDDKDIIADIVSRLESAGHTTDIDSDFLTTGDPISARIKERISDADIVAVFLSSDSVRSPWVEKELNESILKELKSGRLCLVPCRIDDCEFPRALTRHKSSVRLYADFVRNRDKGVALLLERLGKSSGRSASLGEHLELSIPFSGLKIYLTGDQWGWGKNSQLEYCETLDGYLLYGFESKPGNCFKHFASCPDDGWVDIREQLISAGYEVSGTGDADDTPGHRRIWFLLPQVAKVGDGVFKNNVWPQK
jgi:hypothetical protein